MKGKRKKNFKKLLSNNIKVIVSFVVGLLLAGSIVYATTSGYLYDSDEVSYNNQTSGLTATDVQDALDELYTKANNSSLSNLTIEKNKYLYTTSGANMELICCGTLSSFDSTGFTITGTWGINSGTDGKHCSNHGIWAYQDLQATGCTSKGNAMLVATYSEGSGSGSTCTSGGTLISIPSSGQETLYTVTHESAGGTFSAGGVAGKLTGRPRWTVSGTQAIRSVPAGDIYGLFPTIEKTGYSLDGWYTAASGGTKLTYTSRPTSSTTIYPHWSARSYTVYARATGGMSSYSGWTASNTKDIYVKGPETEFTTSKSATVTNLCTAEPTISDSKFACTGMELSDGQLACTNASVTKYWLSASSSCTASALSTYSTTSASYVCKFTGAGTFDPLYNRCTMSGTKYYYTTTTMTVPTSAYKSVSYGQPYGTLPTPIGATAWYTASTGGTQVTSSTTVTTADDHKIYAR